MWLRRNLRGSVPRLFLGLLVGLLALVIVAGGRLWLNAAPPSARPPAPPPTLASAPGVSPTAARGSTGGGGAVPASATPAPSAATASPSLDDSAGATGPLPGEGPDYPLPSPVPPQAGRLRVPVLCYHLINVPSGKEYNVSAAQFAAQMAWLAKEGYHTISPAQLTSAVTMGAALPPRPVLLTFDDNQISPYIHALPVLRRYGFTATFFVNTGMIGRPGRMSAAQLQTLAAAGFTIGDHTVTHPFLTHLPLKQLAAELDRSTADLAHILGAPPRYFAYPYGLYDRRAVAALQARGYRAAFRLYNRTDPPVSPAFMITRQIVAGSWSLATFTRTVQTLGAPGS